MAEIGEIRAKLAVDTAQFTAGIREAKTSLDSLSTASRQVSESLKRIELGDLEQRFAGIGKAAAAGFSSVVAAGANFEQGLLRINTIANLQQAELAQLGNELKNFGAQIGVSSNQAEVAAAFYETLSSGFTKTADAQAVLTATLKLSAAGQADSLGVTKALTGVLNAYGDSAELAGKRADQLFQTVNIGVTTVPELAQSLGLVTTIAASAGVSFEELSAGIATATLRGQTTSSAIEGLRGVIASLVTPTAGAQKAMAELGITVNASTLAEKGLLATLQEINAAAGGNIDVINRIIEGRASLATATALVNDGGTKFAQNLQQIAAAAGTTQAGLDQVNKGVNESSKALASALERLKVSASEAALPFATDLIKSLTDFLNVSSSLPEGVLQSALAITGMGAAAGTAGAAVIGLRLAARAAAVELAFLATPLPGLGVLFGGLVTSAKNLYSSFIAFRALQGTVGILGSIGIASSALGTALAGLNTTVAASTAAISGAGLALTAIPLAISAAVIAYTELEKEVTRANEALLKSDDLRSRGGKVQGNLSAGSTTDILSKSAKELAKQGVTSDTLTQRILDELRGAEQAAEQGETERANRARARAQQLRKLRSELAAEIAKLSATEAKASPTKQAVEADNTKTTTEKSEKERARAEKAAAEERRKQREAEVRQRLREAQKEASDLRRAQERAAREARPDKAVQKAKKDAERAAKDNPVEIEVKPGGAAAAGALVEGATTSVQDAVDGINSQTKAQSDLRAEVQATTEAIREQRAEFGSSATSLNLGGNPYSISDFFAQNQGFFDITKPATGRGRIRDAQSVVSAADAARRSVQPQTGPNGTGQVQPAVQSTATSDNRTYNVNGTTISDPALQRLIEQTIDAVLVRKDFKSGVA